MMNEHIFGRKNTRIGLMKMKRKHTTSRMIRLASILHKNENTFHAVFFANRTIMGDEVLYGDRDTLLLSSKDTKVQNAMKTMMVEMCNIIR